MSFRIKVLLLLLVFTAGVFTVGAQDSAPILTSNFQTALGCDSDFQVDCAASALEFDEIHQLWLATFKLPAGEYEYALVLDGTVYGANAQQGGANIPLSLAEDSDVTFWYAPNTNWVADNVNHILANVPGNYNAEIGCPDTPLDDSGNPGDWAPDCLQTLLQDPDGDGIYEYSTAALLSGNYEAKVAVNLSWSENYGDEGNPGGANIPFNVPKDNAEVVFSWNSESKVMIIVVEGAPKGNLAQAKAYWVTSDTILTRLDPANTNFALYYDANATLELTGEGMSGGTAIPLAIDPDAPDETIAAKFPHLANMTVLKIPAASAEAVPNILRGQFALAATDRAGEPVEATGLQIAGVLDDLYSYDGELGVSWDGDVPTVRVWAPTAQTTDLLVFDDAQPRTDPEVVAMVRDDVTGVWSVTGSAEWNFKYYLYAVNVYVPSEGQIVTNEVTDPYSVSLSMNSTRSQFVDLSNPALQPAGWETVAKPPLQQFEDIILYELHVRDFSIRDESVPEPHRGRFVAFTHSDSNGMSHLRRLADSGLTHIHLLPVFDIATINEDASRAANIDFELLEGLAPDSQQQQLYYMNRWKNQDQFNWGYDPFHYTTPEGSYSTNPNSPLRVVEFRQMVQGLNEAGLRVVMDVVYNHTNAAGQSNKSVLDRVVPGYYHRLESSGAVSHLNVLPKHRH